MCNYAIIIHSLFLFLLINKILYTLLFNHTMIDKTRGQRKQERERRKKKKKKLRGKSTEKGEREREKRRMGDSEREERKKKKKKKQKTKKQTICFDTCWQKEKTTKENNRRHNIRETAATTNICMNHNKF